MKTKAAKNTDKKKWSPPRVKKLGDAAKIIRNINVVAGGDVQFSVLQQSP